VREQRKDVARWQQQSRRYKARRRQVEKVRGLEVGGRKVFVKRGGGKESESVTRRFDDEKSEGEGTETTQGGMGWQSDNMGQ
jgi:hypothetical protein